MNAQSGKTAGENKIAHEFCALNYRQNFPHVTQYTEQTSIQQSLLILNWTCDMKIMLPMDACIVPLNFF